MLKTIRQELKQAMINKDNVKKGLLQIIVSNILLKAKESKVSEDNISQELILSVLSKELKEQKQSLEAYTNGGRQDLVDETRIKIEIIEKYLPKQLTENEIEDIIWDTLAQLGLETPTKLDIGKIMSKILPIVKGKCDGKLVNKILMQHIK